jgi:pimeloyl-ACP methyl ester carboxylesterase
MITLFRFIISALPSQLAARFALFIARFPAIKPKLKERDRAALASATGFTFSEGSRVAYSWGSGPIIILIHGWEGRASQLAPIAQALAKKGFCAIAYDGKAHGKSTGKSTTFLGIQQDIQAITKHLNQPIHAYVAHSAGGLSLMAARIKHNVTAKHFITLAAPRAPYPFINTLKRELGIGNKTKQHCQNQVAKQFDLSWDALMDGFAFEGSEQGKLLAIFDEQDELVDPADADVVIKRWPNAQTYTTQDLGHIKVLWDKQVIDRIVSFVSTPSSTGNPP